MMRERGQYEADAAALRTDCPVVVLNTHHSGLAIARDLAPLGVRVIGLTAVPQFPGNSSCQLEYRPAPDSLTEAPELLETLVKLADELQQRAVLLPTRDHDLNFISRHRAALDVHYRIGLLPPAGLERVMNKDVLADAARRAGLRVPRSVTVREPLQLQLARELRFPCICKPLYASQWRRAGVWEAVGRQKARRVETYDELVAYYRVFSHLDPLVTVQEWVEGGEENLLVFGSYCRADHEVAGFFTARKRLQYPPLAGTGIVVEALPLPRLEEPSRALLRALEFRGISEIEYKLDDRDGSLYLIEVNPRHWDQHGLGTAVGVNLSELLYRDLTDQPMLAVRQSADRVLWIAEAEYARHLARCLLGRAPWSDARLAVGAARTWAVYNSGDPGPFLSLLGLRSAGKKA
jgi:predicted ATP-grasp superfamily ATP-dependent carboligase